MTELDNGYDFGLAKADRVRSHSGGGGGGRGGGSTPGSACNSELETVGNNTCNGNSAQARAEERLPLARRRSRSSSGAQDLEGGELLSSAHGGAHGNARSASDGIRQGGGVDAGGGESQGEARWRQNACLRECLLPIKLLEEKRVRTVLFVYVLFSVRVFFPVRGRCIRYWKVVLLYLVIALRTCASSRNYGECYRRALFLVNYPPPPV